ncbi:hypothetical protein F4825DRAFT_423535 [Nemania diffusa]|nr:hypothetical protein F4825DRAFT_423535 [Nemania diffusa]
MADDAHARPFRAIIVGGGLLGLTAAHIFAKTDMDFVVLEQHDDLTPEVGSPLALMPPTFRVLDQLGLLDTISPTLTRFENTVLMSADDGTVWKEENLVKIMEANHGHGVRVAHRPHYIKTLHSSLPDSIKACIHVKKRVVRIDVADDGVAVHCEDGTVEHGSVVIGADGVHSRTRQAMQSLAAGVPSDTDQPSPFTTTYRALFGNLPPLKDVPRGANIECAAEGVSTQVLSCENRAWFAVYEKLPTPTPARVRWTDDDKRALLRRWAHLHVAPGGYTLRDAFEARVGPVGLVSLEEGLADAWAWRRVVLVGDAVRKLAPQAGLGYNAGVADLVALINGLRRLAVQQARQTQVYQKLRKEGAEAEPPVITTLDLEAVFAEYQARRMADTPAVMGMSERRARMCAWLGPRDRFVASVAAPWLPLGRLGVDFLLAPVLGRCPVLEWLDEKNLPAPRAVAYAHYPASHEREKHWYEDAAAAVVAVAGVPVLTGAVGLAALTAVGVRFFRRL